MGALTFPHAQALREGGAGVEAALPALDKAEAHLYFVGAPATTRAGAPPTRKPRCAMAGRSPDHAVTSRCHR